MARRQLRTTAMYAGQTYGPGEVDTDEMVEGADEAFEAKELYGDEPMPHQTDPSQYDPDQAPAQPESAEVGDADTSEAPRKSYDTRPPIPGTEATEEVIVVPSEGVVATPTQTTRSKPPAPAPAATAPPERAATQTAPPPRTSSARAESGR